MGLVKVEELVNQIGSIGSNTDQRVRTYCRAGTGWDIVAFTAGAPVSGRGDGR